MKAFSALEQVMHFFQSSFVKDDFLFQSSDKSSSENYVPPIGVVKRGM